MGLITIVGTAHNPAGLCNEDELLCVLEAIGPDAIFEEIRPADHDAWYRDPNRYTLEMRAIRKYLRFKPARQVPIDEYIIPPDFRHQLDTLFDYAITSNAEYRSLCAEMEEKKQLGFAFLSSLDFEELDRGSRQLLAATVHASGRPDLVAMLSGWEEQLRRRDDAMLANLLLTLSLTPPASGALLVGAGHLRTIWESIQARKDALREVEWRIWGRS